MTFPTLTWHFIYSRMADESSCNSHRDSIIVCLSNGSSFFLTSMKQSNRTHPNSCSSNFCHPSILNMPFSSCLFSSTPLSTLLNMRYLSLFWGPISTSPILISAVRCQPTLYQPLMPTVCSLHFQLLSCSCLCCLTCLGVICYRLVQLCFPYIRLAAPTAWTKLDQIALWQHDVAFESKVLAPNIGEWGGFRPVVLHRGLQFRHVCVACRGCELFCSLFR